MYLNINGTRIKTEGVISYGKNGNGVSVIYKNNVIDIPLSKDNIDLVLDELDDELNGESLSVKSFDSYFDYFKHLKSKGFEPNSVLDIGANVGEFAAELETIWSNTQCVMIEANKECEKHLSKLNKPYYIEVLGKTDDDIVKFYMTKSFDSATGNSVYPENTSFYNEENTIIEERKTKRLTTLFPEEEFDLIKLDTQGSELDIIKGGLGVIVKARYVLIETAVREYNIGSPMEGDIIEYMNMIGFNKYEVVGSHIWPPLPSMINDRDDIKEGEVFQRDLIFYKNN